jgi:hypothetical protein
LDHPFLTGEKFTSPFIPKKEFVFSSSSSSFAMPVYGTPTIGSVTSGSGGSFPSNPQSGSFNSQKSSPKNPKIYSSSPKNQKFSTSPSSKNYVPNKIYSSSPTNSKSKIYSSSPKSYETSSQESLPKKKKSGGGGQMNTNTNTTTGGSGVIGGSRPGKPPKFPKSKHEKTTEQSDTFFEMEPMDDTSLESKSEPINIQKSKRWKK